MKKFPVLSCFNREFDAESGSVQTASSATESLSLRILPSDAEKGRKLRLFGDQGRTTFGRRSRDNSASVASERFSVLAANRRRSPGRDKRTRR